MGLNITLMVHGEPAPQGSKRFLGNGRMVEASKKVTPWREAIVSEVIRSNLHGSQICVPLLTVIEFYFKRPPSHYGTGKNASILKGNSPKYRSTTPDIDKLLRSTFDGLTQSGLIADDKYIVGVTAYKSYSNNGFMGAEITILEAGNDE